MCFGRFYRMIRVVLVVLLEKALTILKGAQNTSFTTVFREDLAELQSNLQTVYGFLTTLLHQIQRVHFLISGIYMIVRYIIALDRRETRSQTI